jgi:hypothetical protein
MPYKLIKQNGKTCVAKESGAVVSGGCHADEAKAKAHMRALYAAEGREKKELTDEQEEMITKETLEKCYAEAWIPWNIKSFKELDSWKEAQDQAAEIRDTTHDYQSMVSNIMSDNEVTDKISALKTLTDELSKRIKSESAAESTEDKSVPLPAPVQNLSETANKSIITLAKQWLSDLLKLEAKEEKSSPQGVMIWKDTTTGTWRWMARYSNKFRDRDKPPEIIASVSHKKFVEKVDKGLAPYPELWLWHRPEWKFGQGDWVGYDDAGFALAMGSVDKGFEPIAEAMSKLDPKVLRVSHGMPKKSIVRDPDDPTVIIEHETAEISPLPAWAAANTLTSFTILSQEDNMAIPKEKRQQLLDVLGIAPELLDSLEKQNEAQAKEAADAGIQSKEAAQAAAVTPETPKTDVPPESAPAPVQKEAVADPVVATPTPTVQEIANAVSGVLNERLTAIDQRFDATEKVLAQLQGEIKALKETDEAKITKAAAQTPAASLSAMLAQSVRSVIGVSETVVDGRKELAKSKPAETASPANRSDNIGVMIVDQIIKESEQKSAQP